MPAALDDIQSVDLPTGARWAGRLLVRSAGKAVRRRAGRILKGETPADLPVVQAAPGRAIPRMLLARADGVIE